MIQPMREINNIVEATRDEILSNYDGPTSKNYHVRIRLDYLNPKTKTIVFKVKDLNGSGRYHEVRMRLADHKYLTRDSELSHADRVKLAIEDGNVRYWCDCESFLYGGFMYIATTLDSAIRKEFRPPHIRNPKELGISCKHLHGLMKVMPKFTAKIAKAFAVARKFKYNVMTFRDVNIQPETESAQNDSNSLLEAVEGEWAGTTVIDSDGNTGVVINQLKRDSYIKLYVKYDEEAMGIKTILLPMEAKQWKWLNDKVWYTFDDVL